MPRKLRLTWQPGSGKRSGRWRKKYKGQCYYFSGGRGKGDREAYDAAVAAWEQKKLELDAAAPKPHAADYARAIGQWEAVLTWCRDHPGEQQMAATALTKLDRLRKRFAAAKPRPVEREDTVEGHLLRDEHPEWTRALAEMVKNHDLEG